FVFLLVGYGTKVGLVPLHNWLPDAHAEGPTPISAVLSGLLLNVALYALLRCKVITDGALARPFASALLMGFGLVAVAVAAIFLTAGHAAQQTGTQLMENIRGLAQVNPTVGWGLMLGTVAILGMPPFGVFASEFLILTTTIAVQPWAAPVLLLSLGVSFAAVFGKVQPLVFGEPTAARLPHPPALVPVFTHLALVLMLGLFIPPSLADWYRQAA